MNIINIIKDILAPKKCYSCNKEWHFLCRECYNKLDNFQDICYICKEKSYKYKIHENCKKNIYYDNLIILTHYKNIVIKKLIRDFKFYWKKDICDDFVELMYYKLLKTNLWMLNNKNIIVTNIPINFFKKLKRGFNQSSLLAKKISKKLNLVYIDNVIVKQKQTRQQSKLSKPERILNLENSFKINKKYIDKLDNKTILLIDDVVSTWTTLNEASKIFKLNKASKIIWLAIASD